VSTALAAVSDFISGVIDRSGIFRAVACIFRTWYSEFLNLLIFTVAAFWANWGLIFFGEPDYGHKDKQKYEDPHNAQNIYRQRIH